MMSLVIFCITFLGGMSIGAYLVINGHPWFALLTMLITACVKVSSEKGEIE